MSLLKSLWPVSHTELEIHETYITSSIDTFNGWFSWLADIRTIFYQEGRRGYYYGATHQSVPPGLLGVGYFGVPASIGVNRADTHTHEVGHNLNLRHAPCVVVPVAPTPTSPTAMEVSGSGGTTSSATR